MPTRLLMIGGSWFSSFLFHARFWERSLLETLCESGALAIVKAGSDQC